MKIQPNVFNNGMLYTYVHAHQHSKLLPQKCSPTGYHQHKHISIYNFLIEIVPIPLQPVEKCAYTTLHLSSPRRQGQLLPDFDLLKAATALYYDLTPLTCNVRHFAHIPDLKYYQPAAQFASMSETNLCEAHLPNLTDQEYNIPTIVILRTPCYIHL